MAESVVKKVVCSVSGAFRNCFRRFPTVVCFIIALSGVLSYYVTVEDVADKKLIFIVIYYLSVGTLLSLAMHLWCEEIIKKSNRLIVQTVAHALLLGDSIMLYYLVPGRFNMEIAIAHGAVIFAVWVSLFFLSFTKEKNDIPSWNFALRSLKYFVAANIIGIIMCGGFSLLLFSLNQLFGIEIPDKSYLYLLIVCNLLLVVMLFVGYLPQGAAKHDTQPLPGRFLTMASRYLFLPLTAGYLLVLYIYGAKILFTWELPTGWVSWLVTLLVFGCLIVEFCMYPIRIAKSGKWDGIVARWLPVLVLPLLLLMTVGIIRRFCDYGVTINRLYIMTFNIWCYVVCVGLFVTKAKRISWIPISFAAVFLVTSVFPVNYTSITRNILHNDIEKAFTRNGQNILPLTKEQYGQWCVATPDKEVAATTEKLEYMDSHFGKESVSDLVEDGVTFDLLMETAGQDTLELNTYYYRIVPENAIMQVPEGYSQFVRICSYTKQLKGNTTSDTLLLPLAMLNEELPDTLNIDLRQIRQAGENNVCETQPIFAWSNTERYCMIITALSVEELSSAEFIINNIEGYLFEKQP